MSSVDQKRGKRGLAILWVFLGIAILILTLNLIEYITATKIEGNFKEEIGSYSIKGPKDNYFTLAFYDKDNTPLNSQSNKIISSVNKEDKFVSWFKEKE
jgi:hypothetical protein